MANLTEFTANRSKIKVAIGGGALLLFLIYFGLTTLASSRAEERLKAHLIEMGHPYAVQWESVSSSPFGGTIKLQGVQLNLEIENRWSGNSFYRASAESVTLKGFNSKDVPEKAEFRLESVEFPSILQNQRERNLLRRMVDGSVVSNWVQESGRSEIPPFTLQAAWNTKRDSLSIDWSLTLNEMLSAKGKQHLEGPLASVSDKLDPEQLVMNPLESFIELAMYASQVGISRFDLEVQDLGMMSRTNLLAQRYMVANREVEKTSAAAERLRDRAQQSCETDYSELFTNSNACERLGEFYSAKRTTLELTASGKDALTFADFQRGGDALLKLRLQPELR